MAAKVIDLDKARKRKRAVVVYQPQACAALTLQEVAEARALSSSPRDDMYVFNDLPIPEDVFPPPSA